MAKLLKQKVVEITDVGNFNILNKEWFSIQKLGNVNDELKVGEVLGIRVYEDLTVPSGIYSHIIRKDKSYTNVLGDVLQDRNDKDYVMKNDKFRLLFNVL